MIFAVLFDMSIKCVHDTAFISTHKLCMGLCGLDNRFTTIMKLKDLPNCLMASCKKQRPTIQRKEKLKNKHQNPLLGGASNGKYWFSPGTL